MESRHPDRFTKTLLSAIETMIPETMRNRVRTSVFRKMLLITVVTLSISIILTFIISFYLRVHEAHAYLKSRCDSIAERAAHTVTNPAWDFESTQIAEILELENVDNDVVGVIYSDTKSGLNSYSVGSVDDERYVKTTLSTWDDPSRRPDIFCVSTKPVAKDDIVFGKVTVYMTDHFVLLNLVYTLILRTVIDIIVTAIVVAMIFLMFRVTVIKPVQEINRMITRFQNRDFSARAPVGDPDEIGMLSVNFNTMADIIQSHSEGLEKLVDERTGQLFQAEKMASLSEFVASIAHDVNTPVGICLTSASFASEQLSKAKAQFADGSLSRSELEKYFSSLADAFTLIRSNLEKTGSLVQSFKKLTSDRYTENLQIFNVKSYLNDIMTSLRPKLRKTGHETRILCDDSLQVESYAGCFSQIIMNFVVNSLTHAFPDNENGIITIKAENDNGDFVLTYSDNGRGIPKDILEHIFDPFFTTRRSTGGTGLGLSIVERVVTRIMGGTIRCESDPGIRTVFTIRVPKAVRLS